MSPRRPSPSGPEIRIKTAQPCHSDRYCSGKKAALPWKIGPHARRQSTTPAARPAAVGCEACMPVPDCRATTPWSPPEPSIRSASRWEPPIPRRPSASSVSGAIRNRSAPCDTSARNSNATSWRCGQSTRNQIDLQVRQARISIIQGKSQVAAAHEATRLAQLTLDAERIRPPQSHRGISIGGS